MSETHAIHYVQDQAHGNAELLKVQLSIVVYIRQIPHPLQLIISQCAVLQHRSCLLSIQMCSSARESGEDLPVFVDFRFLDALVRHGRGC